MSVVIFAVVMIIVVSLLVWAVGELQLSSPADRLLKAAIILLGALILLDRTGML